MKCITALQIFLVFYALVSLLPPVGPRIVSNSTDSVTATSSSTGFPIEFLNTIVPFAIAGLIELYKRLKDRGWPQKKYKGVVVARPV